MSSTSKTDNADPAPVYEPGRPVRSKRRQRGSLGCRIAYRTGWTETELRTFGGLSPSHKMFLLWTETGSRERADCIVAAMKLRLPETEFGIRMPGLRLRFGCVPANDIEQVEQVRIRLEIEDLPTKKPEHPYEVIHDQVARKLWQVAQEVLDLQEPVRQGEQENALVPSGSPFDPLEDPIACVWVVSRIGKTAGRSDTLANKMKRKNYPVVKVAGKNYCQRKDAMALFSQYKHRLIEQTDAES